MLSLWSSQKSSITWRESTPYCEKIRPISLAKVTLTAWKALHAYFSASAVPTSTWWIGWSRKSNSCSQACRVRSSAVPTTTKGGEKKSSTPQPSRRNSGHIAVPTDHPSGSGSAWNTGSTTLAPVPGGTVERMTTEWTPDGGGATSSMAARRSARARAMKVRSVSPRDVDGVPTHTSETSAPSSASRTSVVARSRPAHTACATSRSTPGSTTGLSPRLIAATLLLSTSTPTTS